GRRVPGLQRRGDGRRGQADPAEGVPQLACRADPGRREEAEGSSESPAAHARSAPGLQTAHDAFGRDAGRAGGVQVAGVAAARRGPVEAGSAAPAQEASRSEEADPGGHRSSGSGRRASAGGPAQGGNQVDQAERDLHEADSGPLRHALVVRPRSPRAHVKKSSGLERFYRRFGADTGKLWRSGTMHLGATGIRAPLPRWFRGAAWQEGLEEEQIQDIEGRWGLRFPADYRLFLRILHAQKRRASFYAAGKGRRVVDKA